MKMDDCDKNGSKNRLIKKTSYKKDAYMIPNPPFLVFTTHYKSLSSHLQANLNYT